MKQSGHQWFCFATVDNTNLKASQRDQLFDIIILFWKQDDFIYIIIFYFYFLGFVAS
jgi:hypothetical protein